MFIGLSSFCQDDRINIDQNHRVIILTDMEADPDDTQSLVRLLLYSNEIEIKGLIATTSCWLKKEVNPNSIHRIINAYERVHTNLLLHDNTYPTPDHLMSLVTEGLPLYGMLGVGDGKDSDGSDWIIRELEAVDDRPLWISVWGGVNTLAQALHTIKETKTEAEAKRLIDKLRVYTISDQDDSGIWIRNQFPGVFYIVSPGDHYGSATWNGIMTVKEGVDNSTIRNDWLAEHIQQGHGPLGALYPDVSWGIEGDTPAFLSLIPNGLNNSEHPEWGGWGGRYELYKPDVEKTKKGTSIVPIEAETRAIWTNASDTYTPYIPKAYGRNVKLDTISFTSDKVTLWRWRDEFQHDFAARMDWCTLPFKEANHPPIPILSHPDRLTLKSGESFRLDAFYSTDPDEDNLSFLWFAYLEAGTYDGEFKMSQPENSHIGYLTAPEVTESQTIHIILKVSDKGTPALSRYKRIIVNVVPD